MIFSLDVSMELADFHAELKIDYQNLSASANSVGIIATESSIIVGGCKQKPIIFYLEEACKMLHTWMLYQQSLNQSLGQIDLRNNDSIQQFDDATTMPVDLSTNLERYLLFSTFLLIQK